MSKILVIAAGALLGFVPTQSAEARGCAEGWIAPVAGSSRCVQLKPADVPIYEACWREARNKHAYKQMDDVSTTKVDNKRIRSVYKCMEYNAPHVFEY